jgi:D-beta-D-heptose 7-phosphate kinase/D-beta-D-heptose 1-phosphate adenosyltransferase
MPNARELMQLSGPNPGISAASSLEERASNLVAKLSLQALVVTRGGEGMSLFEKSGAALRRVDIPTTARSVYDVTGAGDTAIAAFATAVASGSELETAAKFANITAGIKVGKRGTASVSLDEIRASQKP